MNNRHSEYLPPIPVNIFAEARRPKRQGHLAKLLWQGCALAAMVALRITDAAIVVDEWLKV